MFRSICLIAALMFSLTTPEAKAVEITDPENTLVIELDSGEDRRGFDSRRLPSPPLRTHRELPDGNLVTNSIIQRRPNPQAPSRASSSPDCSRCSAGCFPSGWTSVISPRSPSPGASRTS